MLDEKAPVALYYQLKEILLEKIKNNEWPINGKIPTERELCEIFKVSRITVRQALYELEKEGYLYRKQGKGTFVTAPKIEQRLSSFYSFSEEIRKMGYTPSTQVVGFDLVTADDEVAKYLNIAKEVSVYSIRRLRLANQEPFAYEISFIPYELCPGLTSEEVATNGLYNSMRKYGIAPNKAIETFEAVAISSKDALYLQANKNS
ncbi:MAG TPA: GntR family transcriptional regulator, partial [Firmicutes bacterium]|nr:GntR family transcriptional regulator [Bacillota bacterium]